MPFLINSSKCICNFRHLDSETICLLLNFIEIVFNVILIIDLVDNYTED